MGFTAGMAQDLYDAGLRRINSLDSLDPETLIKLLAIGRSGSKSGKAFRLLIAWDLTL